MDFAHVCLTLSLQTLSSYADCIRTAEIQKDAPQPGPQFKEQQLIKCLELGYVLRFSSIAESGPSLKSSKRKNKHKNPNQNPPNLLPLYPE